MANIATLIIADLLINIRGIHDSVRIDVNFDSGRYGVRGFDFVAI